MEGCWERAVLGNDLAGGMREEPRNSSEGTEEEVHAEGADRGERREKNRGELEDTESWMLTDASSC